MTTDQDNRWSTFGREIAARRHILAKKQGFPFTQKMLAEKVGLTDKQISRIETATSGTEYSTIVKIADALEYDDDEKRAFFRLVGLSYNPKKDGKDDNDLEKDDDAHTWFKNLSSGFKSKARDLLFAMYEADKATHVPDRFTQESVSYVAHAQKLPDLKEGEEFIIVNRNTGSLYTQNRESIKGDNLIELLTLIASTVQSGFENNSDDENEALSSSDANLIKSSL